MTYVYKCTGCNRRFEVVKSVKDMDVNEYCPKCDSPGEKAFMPENIYVSKAAVTHAEYNPGLGCVVKNDYHKSEILKKRDLVEVGNDFGSGEKMQKDFDTAREKKLADRWEKD